MKYFFSHLTEIDSIIIELDKLDLSEAQKLHLADLIDSSLYHVVLDAILAELNPDDKKVFLNHLKEDDKIEDKIKSAADDLKDELHRDLKEAKKK